jgi:insulysin
MVSHIEYLEPSQRYRSIWSELQAMDGAHFRFAEKDQPAEFASSTASSMQRNYPPDWVLSGPHLIREVTAFESD